ncbi:hypothetical protein FisN_3Hh107 [Fistulifera solaris]|uniref:Uncharacterized protein n=1 Tax=Fistulifera solaris TaxID=1519565 RepID=A0A1Z5JNM4_FISSO|nr:hypothetical protein FisN_3Hh107 [Fistulifera solaris]|eukprot:GAX15635.1 hypothetical protein FisN_3Hh107 [Fistulifera solaris]
MASRSLVFTKTKSYLLRRVGASVERAAAPHLLFSRPFLCTFAVRCSSSSSSTASIASAEEAKATTLNKTPVKSNVFLDNLGAIFLSSIGLLIAYLVRSYMNTNKRNAIRDDIETQAALDPLEIDDLRFANAQLTPDVFRKLITEVADEEMTYPAFVEAVRRVMSSMKGPAFTVELGHLIDRVIVAALQKHNRTTLDAMPVEFWWVALSLALNSSTPERIQILYQVLQGRRERVTLQDVTRIVDYLQDTSIRMCGRKGACGLEGR